MHNNYKDIKEITQIGTIRKNKPDDLFLCFLSFEKRCLGVINRFSNYKANYSLILEITDEPSEKREENKKILFNNLRKISKPFIIPTQHKDPIKGIKELAESIKKMDIDPQSCAVTLDISTFTKKQLFLVLRLLDELLLFNSLRILYTEPFEYTISLEQPLSYGIKEIAVIPTFAGDYDPQTELILIIFLGYEGDRALALLENIEPHKTIAVIPKPAFRKEWEGRTEILNNALIASIGESFIHYSSSINPFSTSELLKDIIIPHQKTRPDNWYIAPLGTKIQCVGIYYFIRKYPRVASIIYAKPLKHNEKYFTNGIGKTLIIPTTMDGF